MKEKEDIEDVWLKMAELLHEHDDEKINSGLNEIIKELYPNDDLDKADETDEKKDE